MRRDLALDESPPLAATLPFFVSAPVFASLAAALMLYAGPGAFSTRWSPFALAATHLMTLGVFASTMMGALIQILPVAIGAHVFRTRGNAIAIHALLTLGTLTLASAFIGSIGALFPVAGLLCCTAIFWFALACAAGLVRRASLGAHRVIDIVRAVALSLVSLFVTAALGAVLAASLDGALSLPAPIVALTELHLTWGLGGWIGLLTVGVSYQVIPMFQVTEPYPRLVTHAFAPLAFLLLAFASLSGLAMRARWPAAASVGELLLVGAYGIFAVITLMLLRRRKRPAPDATTLYWRMAMASLIGAGPIGLMAVGTGKASMGVLVGIVLLVGAIWSAISGMLYKIIPFLLWYHLQASLDVRSALVPKVKAILPDASARAQFRAHLAALALLVAACVWPNALSRAAAIAFGVSSLWLALNMTRAIRIYRRVMRDNASVGAGGSQL